MAADSAIKRDPCGLHPPGLKVKSTEKICNLKMTRERNLVNEKNLFFSRGVYSFLTPGGEGLAVV